VSAGVDAAVAAGAFVVSLGLTPAAATFARRVGLVDHPGPLKPQARPTPYLGGVGVAVATAVGAAVFRPWLLVPLAMALVLGTVDDLRPLPPIVRLLAELGTGAVLAWVIPTRFDGPGGFVLVMVAAVALMNGFNLVDGLDGLCGTVTVAASVGFAVLLGGDARTFALALAAATLGFVVFNRPPARVYLGDGGAYLIGTAVAALLAEAWAPHRNLATGIGALALVVVPAAELALAVLRRARNRTSLLLGDREHPYDQLVRRGWSAARVDAAYGLVGLALLGIAVAAAALPSPWAAVLVAGAVAVLGALVVEAGFLSPGSTGLTESAQP
jgi:UDP-GlcNAc:undecaprenyl-phosphate/decaprenyl-phosphate GlcNAc-1-phosphate transferase